MNAMAGGDWFATSFEQVEFDFSSDITQISVLIEVQVAHNSGIVDQYIECQQTRRDRRRAPVQQAHGPRSFDDLNF